MEKVILLVEDNPDDVELTRRAFRHNNLANPIVAVGDGEEALHMLWGSGPHQGKPPLRPQVVLLDLKLSRMGGLEVLARMRQDDRTRLQPVVVLTSSAEDHDLEKSYRLGANSYIRKPVDFGEFLEAVRQLGLYWLVLNRTAPG
jgi:CheY-like chemotaxis protein